jgi:hypothetical protein
MDPSALALLNAGSSVLGKALGGSSGGGGPIDSRSELFAPTDTNVSVSSIFDSSGWTVSTGSSSAQGATLGARAGSVATPGGAFGLSVTEMILGGLVLWLSFK